MKLRAITLTNVRRFTGTVRIDGIADGLNVLSEPNEHGKSTLFDALRALFFKPHRTRDAEIKALQPHAGGAPEASVEVETPDGRFTIAKRWLSRPMAEIHSGGRLIAQADAAEDWIARVIGAAEGGPSGLVWVRQGESDLSAGKDKDQKARLEARRDLMSSVAGEVEAMTGGRRMDAALARCRAELAVYATPTGKPLAQGPWKAALDEVETLRAAHAGLTQTARDLHDALDRRTTLRRALAELEAPDAAASRKTRLDEATASHKAAERHAAAVAAAERQTRAARQAVASAQTRLEAVRDAIAERSEAGALAATAETTAAEARTRHTATRAALDAAQAALQTATQARQDAAAALNVARLRQAARDGAARRAELLRRIAEAEAARAAMEAASAAATGPDAAALRRLETLAAELATARAIRYAAAPQLFARYVSGREGAIRAAGSPLPADRAIPVAEAITLDLDGIGTLAISPGAVPRGDTTGRAEAAFKAALDALALPGLDAAREAAAARAEAERAFAQAQATFRGLAPDGLVPLRAALARIPEDPGHDSGPDLDQAQADFDAAEAAHRAAATARESALAREADLRSALAREEAALTGATERLSRAETALDRIGGDAAQAEFAQTLDRAVEELRAEEAVLSELQRAAPDLTDAAARLNRAQSVVDEARREIARLHQDIAVLDANIARSAGEAVEERLAETAERLAAAEAGLARIEHEVAVLRRLDAALEAARGAARDRYFAPVAAELGPLLHLLWPEAELTWAAETLLPSALIRDGQTETVDILSGGTQEQIALLVRLAFARMLAKSGRHAPVILDDALVFTDDDRIERMFDALHRQATDMQIIVLTCRQRAFRDLGGRRLRLETAPDPR